MRLADEKYLLRSVSARRQLDQSDLRNASNVQISFLRHLVCLRERATNRLGLILDDIDKRAGRAGRAARAKLPLPYSSDSRSNQGGELVL
jgi:hypothetical protein